MRTSISQIIYRRATTDDVRVFKQQKRRVSLVEQY